MRNLKTSHAVLFIALAIFTSFTLPSNNSKLKTDWTVYYWFDMDSNYLGQNMVADEKDLTGYDDLTFYPRTVREKGYTVAHVLELPGCDPIPICLFVDKTLFSHP